MSAPFGKDYPVKILVDTNIWLDFFLGRSGRHAAVSEFLSAASSREDVALYVSPLSLKDLSYLIASQLKLDARKSGREVTPDVAASAREVAWKCARNVLERAIVVPVGHTEVLGAFTLRHVHDDLEDDLVLGTAESIGAHALMTHDGQLARHVPQLAMSAEEGLELLAELDQQ